jgi:hypothetical protein
MVHVRNDQSEIPLPETRSGSGTWRSSFTGERLDELAKKLALNGAPAGLPLIATMWRSAGLPGILPNQNQRLVSPCPLVFSTQRPQSSGSSSKVPTSSR